MQILNTIIPIIYAVLLLYFLNKKENSTRIKTDSALAVKKSRINIKRISAFAAGRKNNIDPDRGYQKITMSVQKNKTVAESKRHVPNFGTRMKRELYDRETKK